MKSIKVLLVDSESAFALPVVQCLGRDSRFHVHCLAQAPRPPAACSRFCRQFIPRSMFGSGDALIEDILRTLRQTTVDILLPVDEDAIRALSQHRDVFAGTVRLPLLPSPAAFDIARDKWDLFRFLSAKGMPTPPTVLWTANGDFSSSLESLRFPVVAKKRRARGGAGMKYFTHAAQVLAFLDAASTPKSDYLIQEFVSGADVGVNFLMRAGRPLAVTTSQVLEKVRRFGYPARVRMEAIGPVTQLGQRLLSDLGWDGVANIDLLFDPEKATASILEINPRYWRSLLGSMWAGVNFPHLACLAGMGLPLPVMVAKSTEFNDIRARWFAKRRVIPRGELHVASEWADVLQDPKPYAVKACRRGFRSLARVCGLQIDQRALAPDIADTVVSARAL